jgi:hypothetical protein
MAIGPEDIHYNIGGRLVCAYDLNSCETWDEVRNHISDELAAKIEDAGYEPCEVDVWLIDNGYEQEVNI